MVEVWKIFVFLSPSTTQPTLDLRAQNSSSSLRVKLSSSLRDLSSFTLDLEECKAKAVWTPLILVKTRLFSGKYYQKWACSKLWPRKKSDGKFVVAIYASLSTFISHLVYMVLYIVLYFQLTSIIIMLSIEFIYLVSIYFMIVVVEMERDVCYLLSSDTF